MFQAPPVPSGLPPEFELYFRGALAWHSDKTNQARAAWQSLLRLPQAARPYRATWAAFMLGRSYAETERPRAVQYYQRVRELARAGFVDSLGLAAASVGWEAKAEYELGHYERAMDLRSSHCGGWPPMRCVNGSGHCAPSRRIPEHAVS
jgi:hypothetical protein